MFQQRYAHNPLSLYQTVQQCLSSEMHLVQRSEGVGADNNVNTHWSCIKYMILFNVNISAWSWCFECDGQWHDLPDPAAAQRTQKVNSRMWNRNRENTTNARTPLNKFLQASSDIRYVGDKYTLYLCSNVVVVYTFFRSMSFIKVISIMKKSRMRERKKILRCNCLLISYQSPIILSY